MIFKSKKNKAIQSYLSVLPKCMTKDYGESFEYTPFQVIKSIERHRFNTKYEVYALVLFCSKENFNKYYQDQVNIPEYQKSYDDISGIFFDGHDFKKFDVAKYSAQFSNHSYIDTTNDEVDLICDGDGD